MTVDAGSENFPNSIFSFKKSHLDIFFNIIPTKLRVHNTSDRDNIPLLKIKHNYLRTIEWKKLSREVRNSENIGIF